MAIISSLCGLSHTECCGQEVRAGVAIVLGWREAKPSQIPRVHATGIQENVEKSHLEEEEL